jgi:hypothetical protein
MVENINFFIQPGTIEENNDAFHVEFSNIHTLLEELNSQCIDNIVVPRNFLSIDDYKNKTVKELLIICDYYGIGKEAKTNRYNKSQIVQSICDFESSLSNREIVYRRRKLWFYLSELKNDKFVKKYVLL